MRCHPFLEKTTPELFEEQYAKILSACREEQQRSLSESITFRKYIKSVNIDAIPNALKHHPKGIDGLECPRDSIKRIN